MWVKICQTLYFFFAGQHFVTVKDLYNIRQRMKKSQFGEKTDEEILINELTEISK